MTENDAGGDVLQSGIRTKDSKKPPPRAAAREKQSRMSDHGAPSAFMQTSSLGNAP
jgi:hypothetical protein